jgi:hypothetical protein
MLLPSSAVQVFPIFFGVWVVLGLCSAAFFFLNKNAVLKRRVWPPFVVGTGVLFLGFAMAIGLPAEIMYVAVPAVVAITLLNLRAVQFCGSCGATQMSQNPFSKATYCSKCGAGFEK